MSGRIPDWALERQGHWLWRGHARPTFADEPGPGQESVWDYPRPPRIAPDARRVRLRLRDAVVADSVRALRVLETASPPCFYLPPADVALDRLEPASGESHCEWKGRAAYWDVHLPGVRLERAAWSYPDPFPGFEELKDHVAFYPTALECFVDDERVEPQPGGFYGGWVTAELAGPFKGEPGSEAW